MRLPALATLALAAATPALAHENAGIFHLHPHGSEAAIAAVLLTSAAALLLWRVLRGRR
ncbi:MAG: hypothetical protein ACOCYW_07925 [Roseicyclus sp.]